ncbi:MAG: hypothetical protein MIO93_07210 [ANME-2 cluster archaeon]|nr:hypothetical protein [ANME-2 cluster archaeon]
MPALLTESGDCCFTNLATAASRWDYFRQGVCSDVLDVGWGRLCSVVVRGVPAWLLKYNSI